MSSFFFFESFSRRFIDFRVKTRHADDTLGLTWGGQTYETSDGRVGGHLEISTVDVTDGVDIQATEVVMLSFFG